MALPARRVHQRHDLILGLALTRQASPQADPEGMSDNAPEDPLGEELQDLVGELFHERLREPEMRDLGHEARIQRKIDKIQREMKAEFLQRLLDDQALHEQRGGPANEASAEERRFREEYIAELRSELGLTPDESVKDDPDK